MRVSAGSRDAVPSPFHAAEFDEQVLPVTGEFGTIDANMRSRPV